jgi:hypothetical protein
MQYRVTPVISKASSFSIWFRGRRSAGLDHQLSPFSLHDVVHVTVLPPKQDLQTFTHWFNCFLS